LVTGLTAQFRDPVIAALLTCRLLKVRGSAIGGEENVWPDGIVERFAAEMFNLKAKLVVCR